MSDSPPELPPNSDNNLELNGELERMTEELEKIIGMDFTFTVSFATILEKRAPGKC